MDLASGPAASPAPAADSAASPVADLEAVADLGLSLGFDLESFLAAGTELLAVRSTADRPEDLSRAVDFVVDFVCSGPNSSSNASPHSNPGSGPGAGANSVPERGLRVERFESRGKPSALIYAETHAPSGDGAAASRPEFRVILNGHLDVVPGELEQFRPRRDGDRLYARGAQDMKLTALAQALVFRQLAAVLPYPLALQLVADEEIGGLDGTGYQVGQGVTGDFVIVGEHSRLDLVADSKGLLHATLRARGRSAHGAYPWLGDNALTKLVNTLTRLSAAYPTPAEAEWRTTMNLARIDTPNQAFNRVPDAAEAWLDIRFPAEDADLHGRTASEIAAHLQSFCEPGVTAHVGNLGSPHHLDHDHPQVTALRRAAQGEGYPSAFLYKHGSGDSRFYAARGIASVVFGIGGDGQHGADEYAEIPTIEPYCRALAAYLLGLESEESPDALTFGK